MSVKSARLSSNKGFTLVELLIVVAIIGVLASQGVPAYRRMIQKSRKGEAQVMLGNISTAESGFFSEYGAYGNNIARMGATMEGNQFTYTAGVDMAAGCGATLANGAYSPTAATVPALGNNPQYQNQVNGLGQRMGRMSQTSCLAAALAAAPHLTYTASATGFIRGGTSATMDTCNGGLANCDQWTINENRQLINFVDGVN